MTENYVPPNQQRNLRACMVCSIVMTQNRFMREGCPNCEDFLHLQGSMEAIIDCTSQVFEGLITLADPSKSWVAKWQRLDGYVRGVYATKVSGQLPEEIVSTMEEEARVKYIPLGEMGVLQKLIENILGDGMQVKVSYYVLWDGNLGRDTVHDFLGAKELKGVQIWKQLQRKGTKL
ncbi:90043f2f-15fc-4e80-ae15-ac12bf4d3bef [Sclerotinia trifoliorum]|uniref:Transcription elongation factor SPT4 n=1 Tax=Sclerotinia trifoliorum TaxID=28548 RepID=A0A8H2VLW7_9HELO|nr:90043f2f-15fc-4e80-ae15-ac12bf4d3bef [Sclerotinia trifoliorum]